MSEEKLDWILKTQIELSGQIHGLTLAVAHLFAIEARQNPGGAAERALADVAGTVDGVARQLPGGPEELRAAVIAQLRRCLDRAAEQIDRAKRQPPTSETHN